MACCENGVIPAQAGFGSFQDRLDARLRGRDADMIRVVKDMFRKDGLL